MEINNLLAMDSNIVLGIVNERLRLECQSKQELVSRYSLDQQSLDIKMASLGYYYDPGTNQYKCDGHQFDPQSVILL